MILRPCLRHSGVTPWTPLMTSMNPSYDVTKPPRVFENQIECAVATFFIFFYFLFRDHVTIVCFPACFGCTRHFLLFSLTLFIIICLNNVFYKILFVNWFFCFCFIVILHIYWIFHSIYFLFALTSRRWGISNKLGDKIGH